MTSKTAISLEDDLLYKMEDLAEKLHLSRSGVFAEAAREYILRHENQILMEAINDNYGNPTDKEEAQLIRNHKKGESGSAAGFRAGISPSPCGGAEQPV